MTNNPTKIHYQRPQLADYQIDALFNDARYGIVEASTKAGKTAACLVWIIEEALQGKSGQDFWGLVPCITKLKLLSEDLKPDCRMNHLSQMNLI
jgi:hypothetical protein